MSGTWTLSPNSVCTEHLLGSRIDECYKQSLRECEVDLEFEMEKNMGREEGRIFYVEKNSL